MEEELIETLKLKANQSFPSTLDKWISAISVLTSGLAIVIISLTWTVTMTFGMTTMTEQDVSISSLHSWLVINMSLLCILELQYKAIILDSVINISPVVVAHQ